MNKYIKFGPWVHREMEKVMKGENSEDVSVEYEMGEIIRGARKKNLFRKEMIKFLEEISLFKSEKVKNYDDKFKVPKNAQIRLLNQEFSGGDMHYKSFTRGEVQVLVETALHNCLREFSGREFTASVASEIQNRVLSMLWIDKKKIDPNLAAKIGIAEPVSGSEKVVMGAVNPRGVKRLEKSSEGQGGQCSGCGKWNEYQVGNYVCWECKS